MIKLDVRTFYVNRLAFIIYNSEINFMQNSEMSHYEYCCSRGISKEDYKEIIRVYNMNGQVVFYKDNFIYDNKVIKEGLKYMDKIQEESDTNTIEIYFGVNVGKIGKIWPLNYHYGTYKNNSIVRR